MQLLTPKQIVTELNRYIIGQDDAKKSVAVALRNRYRRMHLAPEIREEITPKNIIMKGPTGVGKTEIARRLAKLVKAPFVKVEATKFTEVGYVGRDVESMIRDLVEAAIRMVKEERIAEVEPKAQELAEKKIIDILLPIRKKANTDISDIELREELLRDLKNGSLDNIPLEAEITETPKAMPIGAIGAGAADIGNLGDVFASIFPPKKKKRKFTVKEAYQIFFTEEANKLIDNDSINAEAIKRAEQEGIIFIDEMDKIAAKGNAHGGPDVSREGVQRDILPIVEGCTVNTKYGNVKTDFILFIAAGAFHIAKISDLIPELQGRFPIFVELNNLTEEDFYKILTEPDNAIIMQYTMLLGVDKVNLKFTEDALRRMAKIAYLENENKENIGARRLHAIMEQLLEDISFNANGQHEMIDITIDQAYVDKHLEKALKTLNLKKFII